MTCYEKNCSSDQEKLLKFEAEEQLKSKLEKIIGIEKHAGKVRKYTSFKFCTKLKKYLGSIVDGAGANCI